MATIEYAIQNDDPELRAIEVISIVIAGLTSEQAGRVFRYAADRFGTDR